MQNFENKSCRSSTSTFLISHLNPQRRRFFYTGSGMKHYTIFIKTVSNPKGRKLERKLAVCILWHVSLGLFHQAWVIMQTNQNHTIFPSQSYPTVFMSCCNLFFVKKQFNANKTIFFVVWQAAVFKLLISVVLFFCSKYSLKMSINKITPKQLKKSQLLVDSLALILELLQLTVSTGIYTSLNNANF